MASPHAIVSVSARQVYTGRGHPGIEATVRTASGAIGVAVCAAGISVGQHEVAFVYDGGPKWRGKGVQRAVENVNERIAPALHGVEAHRQLDVDHCLLNVDGPDAKARLGGNATAAVSAAALKAGAASLGIPLYQHIGGANACTLPAAGVGAFHGGDRYGGGRRSGGKPSHEFCCYGFETFEEASYAGWDVATEWADVLKRTLGISHSGDGAPLIPAGCVQDDRRLWELQTETVVRMGYEGRIGLQIDVAAGTYYDAESQRYLGLFSPEPKTRDDLIAWYHRMVADYPFVILEDPLDEVDYEGHAILTRELGIQVVGDDLFTTNPVRVAEGAAVGAANTVLLKVNQIGTISEAFEMVRLAYRHGYGVMPCSSRGEGVDIADYAVGLNCGTIRGSATGPTGNRFLQIEAELGPRAHFVGKAGLKGERFRRG